MIAKCKKGVVNKGKHVLFKTTHHAKLSAGCKAFLLLWLCVVFCPVERGEGVISNRK